MTFWKQLLLVPFAVLVLAVPGRAFDDTTIDEDGLDDPGAIEREHDAPPFDGHTEYGEPAPEEGRAAPPPAPWATGERGVDGDDLEADDSDIDEETTDEGADDAHPGRRRSRDSDASDDERDVDRRAPAHEDSPGGRVEESLDHAGEATHRGLEHGAEPVGRGLERAMKATGRGIHKAIDGTGKGLRKAGDALTGEPPQHGAE